MFPDNAYDYWVYVICESGAECNSLTIETNSGLTWRILLYTHTLSIVNESVAPNAFDPAATNPDKYDDKTCLF